MSLMSPAWAEGFFTTSATWEAGPLNYILHHFPQGGHQSGAIVKKVYKTHSFPVTG